MEQIEKFIIEIAEGLERVFFHRGTHADHGVIQQIFFSHDYSLRRLKREHEIQDIYGSIINSGKVPLIIDAGANIGASAVWFGLNYPTARIVAFEPDFKNFNLLRRNTIGLNIEVNCAAVGARDGAVNIIDPGLGEWGYQTAINKNGNVKMLSLDRVIDRNCDSGYVPFIVKIDIEGGEEELFSSHTNWIDKFPLLIIELHDWLFPKKEHQKIF